MRRIAPGLPSGRVAAGCGGDGEVVERADTTVTTSSTTTAAPRTTTEPSGPVVVELRVERRATEWTEGFEQLVRETLTDPRGWQQAGFEIRFTPDATNVVVVAAFTILTSLVLAKLVTWMRCSARH